MQTWTSLQRPEWQQSGVPAGKGSWVVHPSHKWDFKSQFRGLLLIIPGFKPVASSVCLQKCSSGFNFYNASCFIVWIIRLLRPQGTGQDLRSFRDSKTHSLSCLRRCLTCWWQMACLQQACLPGRVQARSEVGQRPAFLLLKPEQDYLHFNFPTKFSDGQL